MERKEALKILAGLAKHFKANKEPEAHAAVQLAASAVRHEQASVRAGSLGGKSRARRYTKRQLSAMGKLGGRPPKVTQPLEPAATQ
jgi:hypothetical protein